MRQLFYKRVDEDGVVNFTDDLNKVPPRYRNQVEREAEEDTSSAEFPTSVQSPWREKTRPWNEQLKDATAKLETVDNKIIEKAQTMSGHYWSPTMVELEKLKGERSKYQAQVDKPNKMLK